MSQRPDSEPHSGNDARGSEPKDTKLSRWALRASVWNGHLQACSGLTLPVPPLEWWLHMENCTLVECWSTTASVSSLAQPCLQCSLLWICHILRVLVTWPWTLMNPHLAGLSDSLLTCLVAQLCYCLRIPHHLNIFVVLCLQRPQKLV